MRIAFLFKALVIVVCADIVAAEEPPLGSAGFAPSLERPFGWRGDGSGRFPGATPATEWSETKNVRWSAQVGSGYSSPILTEKLAIVASEPNRLSGVERNDGKVRWSIQISPDSLTEAKNRKTAADYEPPKDGSGMMAATPITDGKSIYVVVANGIVCAVGIDGKSKWTAFIDADQNTGYGRSSSPLLVAGKLIVHMTNLYAFDPATGKQLWVNTEATSKYGTPTSLKVAGTDLIVTPAGDVVRANDGKTLGTEAGSTTHTSPVALDGIVYFAEAAAKGLRFNAKYKDEELWSGTIGDEVFGSPLVHDGILFTASGKGELFAFAANGKGDQVPFIKGRPLFGKEETTQPRVYASATLAGKHLFLNSNHGETIVLEATREAKRVTRNRLPSGTGSSPVFSGNEMILRDGNKLFCIGR
jgi:outer membrane protein assembly factor BamB